MPDHPLYHSQVLDHLGLVAGRFDALGIGAVLAQATQPDPPIRDLTVGRAVKAMGLNGLGVIKHALSLVPRFFHKKPTDRLMAPRGAPAQRNDDALGRALETLDTSGVTALYSLMAVRAAKRLGLAPTLAPLDTPSFHVDGRSNSHEAPDEQVVHITRGDSRDHRSDVHQGMLEVIVEPHAGSPVLMKPLSGNRRDGQECGHLLKEPMAHWHTPYGTTSLVAASALSSDATLPHLAKPQLKGIPRVPATLRDAPAALAQAAPQTMPPLPEGYRSQALTSTDGGVEHRWLLSAAEPRQPQARRPVEKPRLKHRNQDRTTWQKRCGTAFACEADAPQALARFAHGVQATSLPPSTVRAQPHYGKRGRPGRDAPPAHGFSQVDGALASSRATHQGLVDQHRCFMLATHELDETQRSPQAVVHGDKGQGHAARGCRFLQAPQFLAAALYLTKPERIMALLMVMTVCLFVYAA